MHIHIHECNVWMKVYMDDDVSTHELKWKSTQDVNMENPNLGKTTATLRLQDITMWGLQWWGTEATTSCSLTLPTDGYNRGNDLLLPYFANRRLQQRQRPLPLSLSLSHSVYGYTLYTDTLYINIRNTTSTQWTTNSLISLP